MADHSHGKHEHGSMDIRAQEKTFAGFLRLTSWTLVLIAVLLVFMALANA